MYIKNVKNPSTYAAYMNEQGVFDLLFATKPTHVPIGEPILLYQDLGTTHGLCFTHIVIAIDPNVYPDTKYTSHTSSFN